VTLNPYKTTMREQLIKFLTAVPFQPFAVELDTDKAYQIETADHASVLRTILVIEDDNGAADLISIPHIIRLSGYQPALNSL
jgi:hypothetical protein